MLESLAKMLADANRKVPATASSAIRGHEVRLWRFLVTCRKFANQREHRHVHRYDDAANSHAQEANQRRFH